MLLELINLSKSFKGFLAVMDFSLGLEKKGDLISLIGPNGAGKSTVFNLITGDLIPDSGVVRYKGENIIGQNPSSINRKGIARSFQITNIFQGLTVYENIRVACQSRERSIPIFGNVSKLKHTEERTIQILDMLGLLDKKDQLAGNLSHGDQRYLEIGLALATEPQLLLMDEPTSGMTPKETQETMSLIHRLRADVAILLIEHDISVVMELSDTVYVMNDGSLLAHGTPEEIRTNEQVKEVYLGREV